MADGSVIIEAELKKDQLQKGIDNIKDDLDKLKKPTQSSTNNLIKGLNSIGQVATKTGVALTAGVTTPLVTLATAGVKYNAQMEDFEANLTTLLGNADKAKDMLADLKEMANTTPFETSDLLEATQMMLGFGLQADKTKGYLQTLGDISMGNSEKLMSLTRAFSQMGAAGKATMEDINQMIDAGFNPLQIMCETTGKSMAELRDEVSAGKISFEDVAEAMQIATSEGGRYYNAMEKASQTMNGKLSTAMDALKTALGELTKSLLPIVTKVVEKITDWANAFASLDEDTQKTILTIAGIVVAAGPVLMVIGQVSTGISTLIGVIGKLKTAFSVGGAGAKALSAAFTFLSSPVGFAIAVIGAVIALLVVLYNKSETFRNAVNKAFETIKTALLDLWEKIKPPLEQLGQAFGVLLEKLAPVGEFLVNVLSVAFSVLAEVLSVVISVLAEVLAFLITFVSNVITFWSEDIPNAIQEFINFISELPNKIWDFLVNGWNNIVSFFTEGIPNFINSVIQWFSDLPYKIGELIGKILGTIVKFGLDAWNWVTTELPKIIQGIIQWFSELPEKIKAWLVETINKIINWGIDMNNKARESASNFINTVITWIKELPGKIKTWLVETVNKVIDWGYDMNNKARDAISTLINNIINWFKELPNNIMNIGKNLVQGLWNGIDGARNWLKNKISSFASGIINGFKSAFGIHSPSKVFNQEIGRFLALGLGEGFDDNINKVFKKMKSTVDFETQKLSANLTSSNISKTQIEDNRQAVLRSIDDNKEITVNTTTKLDSKVVAREVNKVNARQKLQYGLA